MEEKNQTAAESIHPAPKNDVDDLIFRGEGWLVSDR